VHPANPNPDVMIEIPPGPGSIGGRLLNRQLYTRIVSGKLITSEKALVAYVKSAGCLREKALVAYVKNLWLCHVTF
jgi:hypothetical protein